MNWKLLVFSIIVMFFLVENLERVFGEISYPSTSQRLKELPIYCIVEPVGMTTADKNTYINLATKGISDWNSDLQDAAQINPAIWKLDFRVISASDSTENCSIVVYFHESVEQLSTGGTTVGVFRGASQIIEIAFESLSLERIYNVIIHEIGHSLGLGHYVSDDNKLNEEWWSGDVFSPSIMIPTTNVDPSLMGIMTVDVQKVYSIYGSEGFYAFSPTPAPPTIPTTPIIPEPGIPKPIPEPIIPIIPIKPFESIQIIDTQILLKSNEATLTKIIGQIKDEVFRRGVPVYVTIKNPDDSFDTHKLRTTSEGYFELPLRFDQSSEKGLYIVEASYLDHKDESMDFVFSANFEHIVSIPKTEKSEPVPVSKLAFGKYLEDISIQVEGDDYTVKGYLSTTTSSQSIRITAENACPFKKEIFQKDFLYRPGQEVSFSFNQPSAGKPDKCTIHFTMTDFNANLLDTIQVDYDVIKKKQTTSPTYPINPITPTNPTTPTLKLETTKMPDWIKNNAAWWSDGLISDEAFSKGIEYMIKEGIISIPQIQLENQIGNSSVEKIPDWIKNNAAWWSDGLISDEAFSKGIEYMIKEGIIRI